jgi:hypothetical protein
MINLRSAGTFFDFFRIRERNYPLYIFAFLALKLND